MKYLRKFNENLDEDGNKIWSEDDDLVLHALESEMTTQLMEVVRPFYEENGYELTKEYMAGVFDNFTNEEFIEDYYNIGKPEIFESHSELYDNEDSQHKAFNFAERNWSDEILDFLLETEQDIESILNKVEDLGDYTMKEWISFFEVIRKEGI